MLAVIQRVSVATVVIHGQEIAAISQGMLVLIGFEKHDNELLAKRLVEKILKYRIFPDGEGKMNINLVDSKGSLLIVPQFTLAADTTQGTRPGFSTAMLPNESNTLFNFFVKEAQLNYANVSAGIFGADMQVSLCNDGPVTFILESQHLNS